MQGSACDAWHVVWRSWHGQCRSQQMTIKLAMTRTAMNCMIIMCACACGRTIVSRQSMHGKHRVHQHGHTLGEGRFEVLCLSFSFLGLGDGAAGTLACAPMHAAAQHVPSCTECSAEQI